MTRQRDARNGLDFPGQCARFRIYANGPRTGLFFTVRVFASAAAMYRFLRASSSTVSGRTHGMVRRFHTDRLKDGKKIRTTGELGDVLLIRKYLRTGVLTHEMGHCTFAWAKRKGLLCLYTPHVAPSQLPRGKSKSARIDSVEEQLCYALGWFSRDLVDRLYKLELLK